MPCSHGLNLTPLHPLSLPPPHSQLSLPGLYIPDDPRYGPLAGLGVRLEDDVLVTAAGAQVLSDQVGARRDSRAGLRCGADGAWVIDVS